MAANSQNNVKNLVIEPLRPVVSPADEITRLRKLYELSMNVSGDPMQVFEMVARLIGQLLDVKVVCLSEVQGDKLNFLSVYVMGEMTRNAGTCDLKITPCATVEQTKDYRVYDRVMERFPEAKFLKSHNAYSYCGFPALGSNGEVLAVTCLLDDRPHEFTDADHDMLRIFGQRIAVEIERQRHIDEQARVQAELSKYRDHLQELVEERTRALKVAQQELVIKERLAALGQITATVSHELRNPLGAIKPSLHYLRKTLSGLDEKALNSLERIERSVNRCDHIIDELLDFSRNRPPVLQYLPVDTWLDDALADQMRPESISLMRERQGSDPVIVADPDLMLRAVINVCDNACQAMMDRLGREAAAYQPQLRVSTGLRDGRVELCIADNGTGIDDEIRDRIFEPMFSTKSFGVGLGLPIVKRIMEQHNGGVEIDSRPGAGTSVILWLPVKS